MNKKEKIRLIVPQGAKGKIKNGETKASEMILPPGKIKFTGIGEDGKLEAEVDDQMSASDYMKNVEETSKIVSKNSKNKKVSISANNRAEKAKSTRKSIMLSSSTPASQNQIGKITLEKSESIIETAKELDMFMFTPDVIKYNGEELSIKEYYDKYEENLLTSISLIKNDAKIKLFEDIDEKVRKLISSSSPLQLRLAVKSVALLIHQDIDRRTRVSMSKKSLEEFLSTGKILNINVDSASLVSIKKKRDEMLGNKKGINKFSFVPVELMHGVFVDKIEEMLYSSGTRIGSEEFADYGRGIELVLRSENAPRIGYGTKDSYEENGVFTFITEEDEKVIELAVFGSDGKIDDYRLIKILESYVRGDMSNIVRTNEDDLLEAFIVGEVSLNDIEHIKIPLSIFNARNKRVPVGNPIAGKNYLSIMMRSRKLSEDKIQEFFDKEGNLGGGYSPKYLSYLLEYEAAIELKERLISFGIQDVLFTNKEGIDILAEKTWTTPKPNQKFGLEALKKIVAKEIELILDKYAPTPKPKVLPKKKEQDK